MKAFVLLASFIILFTLSGRNAYACSCFVPSSSEIEAMTDAQFSQRFLDLDGAVFLERVVKKSRGVSSGGGSVKITFEAERYWEGVWAKRVSVYAFASEAACGVNYEVGERHLVIATRYRGNLQTNLCAHLLAAKNRAVILKKLGRGKRPKG